MVTKNRTIFKLLEQGMRFNFFLGHASLFTFIFTITIVWVLIGRPNVNAVGGWVGGCVSVSVAFILMKNAALP
jgi:hypothetical protein